MERVQDFMQTNSGDFFAAICGGDFNIKFNEDFAQLLRPTMKFHKKTARAVRNALVCVGFAPHARESRMEVRCACGNGVAAPNPGASCGGRQSRRGASSTLRARGGTQRSRGGLQGEAQPPCRGGGASASGVAAVATVAPVGAAAAQEQPF